MPQPKQRRERSPASAADTSLLNETRESQLSQNKNPSEMETVEDLRRQLHHAEKANVELTNQRNREMTHYEKEIMKLRLELERGEALRRGLESELSVARKEAHLQMYSAEEELCDAKTKLVELQVLHDKHQQKVADTEKMFQSVQQQREEEQKRFLRERDDIRRMYHNEMVFLIKEKAEAEKAFQEMNDALQNLQRRLREVEAEHSGCSHMLRRQADQLEFRAERQDRLVRELEAATERTRKLEENNEAARAAHLESKYTSEIMQLRIRELEDALNAEKGSRTEALSVLESIKRDFRESENAHEREKRVLQRQRSSSNMQVKELTVEKKVVGDLAGRIENIKTNFNQLLAEGPTEEISILLSLYQRLVEGRVLAKQPEAAPQGLSWTELCVLLHENVDALILNFHRANEKISYLEHVCKNKTDTMKDLQQNHEDAFEKIAEQLKAQEHCWHKEKKYLEQQYSNLLAEAHARAQEYEETVQKNREKMYGLEQNYEKLANENVSVKNTLTNAQKEHSSLLAACALLAGALCPLYVRICAMSSQRDLLQDQFNIHELVNQKIRSLLQALPVDEENNQDEERLRQRKAKVLIYVFRRAVIAVLAVHRLKALARRSCSLFIWTSGLKGGIGIRVCVGESRGRQNVSRFEEEGVDSVEALEWLTSSNLHSAIISSISELQDVLNKPDPNSWPSDHSLVSAARNSFSKLMEKLSVMMGTAPLNHGRCITYLERNSLVQRLACGLHRLNAQALEVGLYDGLPSTRNIGSLQQQVFEFSRKLHTAEVECQSLHLQLADFRWSFDELKKEAEKAQSLQEQLNALQHRMTTQGNIQEELSNALQREREARLLLHEQEQRLQELNRRLELPSSVDTDKSQNMNESLRRTSEAPEELRRRDRVLNQQKRLLKHMEEDRCRLQENIQEAERALQVAAKEKELLINHMKAVEATLHEVRDQALMSSAAAATSEFCLQLPNLQLETFSEEALRGRPEVIAFQAVLISFMDIYQLAASRIETLVKETESLQLRIAAQSSRVQTPHAREGDGSRRESRRQHSYKLENQLEHSYIPDFWALPAEANISSSVIPTRTGTGPAEDIASSVTADRTTAGLSRHTSSSAILNRSGTGPAVDTLPSVTASTTGTGPAVDTLPSVTASTAGTGPAVDVSPSVIPSTTGTGPAVDVSPSVIANRTGTGLSMEVSSNLIPNRSGTGSSTNITSGAIPHRTLSSTNMPSSPLANRIGTGSSMDISSNVIPYRTFTLSSVNTPSNVTLSRSGTGSSMDISSHVIPNRTFTLSLINPPSNVTPSRTGTGSSMDISSHVMSNRTLTPSSIHPPPNVIPSRTGTGSSMDISSHVMSNRTLTLSSIHPPPNLIPSRIGAGSTMEMSYVMPNRALTLSTINPPPSLMSNRSATGASLDISFFMIPNRFGTGLSREVPNRTFTLSSTDTPVSFRPHRTSSLPSVRSFNLDILSSTRRDEES